MKKNILYCLVYRTGGTENFKWNRTLPMTKVEATEKKWELEKMGYKTLIVDYNQSLSIGLPEGYEA